MLGMIAVAPDPEALLAELARPETTEHRRREIVFTIAFHNLEPFVLLCRILLGDQIAKQERAAKEQRSRDRVADGGERPRGPATTG